MEKKAKYAINPKILRKNAKYAEKIKTANCKKKMRKREIAENANHAKTHQFLARKFKWSFKSTKNSLRSEML